MSPPKLWLQVLSPKLPENRAMAVPGSKASALTAQCLLHAGYRFAK